MKTLKEKKEKPDQLITNSPSLTLGEYAYSTIAEQYHNLVKREPKVLADQDPEHLHQMRVASRRLRTALQVFATAIALPKCAGEKQIGALARTLGGLRDLDVQIADLQTIYRPQLKKSEQGLLDDVIETLKNQRQQAYTTVSETLGRSRYRELKAAYETWLKTPQFTPLASLPVRLLLPDLLSPLLSELLLHPAWMVSANDTSTEANETLHDLRKAFKHVRYQTEFFVSFYGESFNSWVSDIKKLQEQLGKLQDSHVLEALLATHLPKHTHLPTLQKGIQQTRVELLSNWDDLRQQYLNSEFRRGLYQMLLAESGNG